MASGGVGLLDYDGDGRLDVYLVQGGHFPPERHGTVFQAVENHGQDAPATTGDRLFRNRGDGTFEDVSGPAGIASFAQGYGHGVTVGDYDNDGHPDLFLTRWRSSLRTGRGSRLANLGGLRRPGRRR
jgi:hypothetical protein